MLIRFKPLSPFPSASRSHGPFLDLSAVPHFPQQLADALSKMSKDEKAALIKKTNGVFQVRWQRLSLCVSP